MRLAALRCSSLKLGLPGSCSGQPSFKLEHLSAANHIEHLGAHEALSDVVATIGLARLIRSQQPRLYDWALKMRDQHQVMQMLSPASPEPLLHTSSRIPATRGSTTLQCFISMAECLP